jgi:GNAT superfamily N-acetyltransferase
MGWEFSTDVEAYAAAALPLLEADPVRHTIPLTVVEVLRRRRSTDGTLFGWSDGGAVLWSPGFELLLSAVPEESIASLVAGLRARGADLPGCNGEAPTAARFAAAWTAGTPLRGEPGMRTRLYALDGLRPSTAGGAARTATGDDVDLILGWCRDFEAEAHAGHLDTDLVRRSITDGLFQLWYAGGEPVATAGRKPAVAGVARVGPVWTPPEHRRRGYGAAVTAAVTAEALASGAAHVVLFTDLANPVSNSIYQRIGYAPVTDREIVRFVG